MFSTSRPGRSSTHSSIRRTGTSASRAHASHSAGYPPDRAYAASLTPAGPSERLRDGRRAIVRALHEHPRLELAGEAADGEDALAQVRRREPDIAVLDVRMPALDGMEVLASLAREASPTRVMLLSAYSDGELVYKALAAGAAGYLSKDADEREITRAILAVAAGETVVSSELGGEVLGSIREQALRKAPVLSPREREILALIAQGYNNAAIATRLALSIKTVQNHVSNIFGKLQVVDRAQAIVRARDAGFAR